jgi:O-antigen ligase
MGMLNKNNNLTLLKILSLYGIAITIVFSVLNLNSIFIMLFTIAWLLEGNLKSKFKLLGSDPLFLTYTLYFLVQVYGILFSEDLQAGWKHVESKLGFLVLPMVFCSSGFITKNIRKHLIFAFCIMVTIATLYCLIQASLRFLYTSNPEVFFYHELVSPFSHHAIYFSVFIFICIAFLLFEAKEIGWLSQRKWIIGTLVSYLFFILILLSSKLILSLTLIFLLIVSFRHYKSYYNKWRTISIIVLLLGLTAAIVFTDNFVRKRFVNLFEGNMQLLKQDKFNTGTAFTGLEFRILLWRFTYEILDENKAFINGVGPPDSQQHLVKKYLSMDMYPGDPAKGDHGYLAYNCHNQFLQTTLQSGIIGLIILFSLCFMLVLRTVQQANPVLTSMIFVIFAFFMIESVFERQYGMILCTFFPLIYLYSINSESR